MPDLPPEGWYPDPESAEQVRYWDGAAWTDQRAPRHAARPAPSRRLIVDAMNVTLVAMGHRPWDAAEARRRIRRSMRESFPLLFGDRWTEAQRIFYERFEAAHLNALRPLPGADAQWRFSPRPTRKGWRPELQPETARQAAALLVLYPSPNGDDVLVPLTVRHSDLPHHAGQISLSRRYASGLGFNVSYWYSKALDYLSAMNLSGAAAKPLAGENDLAQNPFDLAAEHGPSLFDARHRFVASASWSPTLPATTPTAVKVVFNDWQINVVASHNSGTPFTVSDSANVALQANSPPISGFAASRPDLVGDPNAGPRTVDQWLTRDSFRRLNPATEAGQFGDAGRNIARGPSYTNVDLSLVRNFTIHGDVRLQFRAEAFNVANHANFGLPVADLNSANFGRILSAGPPRLLQFALKLTF